MSPFSIPQSIFPAGLGGPRTEVLIDGALPEEFSLVTATVRRTERVGNALIVFADRRAPRAIRRSDNVHLRLAEAADGDDAALIDFVTQFGLIRTRFFPPWLVLGRDDPECADISLADAYFAPPAQGVEEVIKDLADRLERDLDGRWSPPDDLRRALIDLRNIAGGEEEGSVEGDDPDMLHVLEFARWWMAARTWEDPTGPIRAWLEANQALDLPSVETFAELRFGALLVRDALMAARWAQSGETPDWRAPLWKHTMPPADEEQALLFVCDIVNHALADYAPRIVAVPAGIHQDEVLAARASGRPTTLVGGACVALGLDLADGGGYRVCARNRCGKLFPFKRGGARHEHYRRADAQYCSPECQKQAGKERARARKTDTA